MNDPDSKSATAQDGSQLQDDEQLKQRVEAFQAQCAAVRRETQREVARLAQQRQAQRTRLGISSQLMAKWQQEHQQMLSTQQLLAHPPPPQ